MSTDLDAREAAIAAREDAVTLREQNIEAREAALLAKEQAPASETAPAPTATPAAEELAPEVKADLTAAIAEPEDSALPAVAESEVNTGSSSNADPKPPPTAGGSKDVEASPAVEDVVPVVENSKPAVEEPEPVIESAPAEESNTAVPVEKQTSAAAEEPKGEEPIPAVEAPVSVSEEYTPATIQSEPTPAIEEPKEEEPTPAVEESNPTANEPTPLNEEPNPATLESEPTPAVDNVQTENPAPTPEETPPAPTPQTGATALPTAAEETQLEPQPQVEQTLDIPAVVEAKENPVEESSPAAAEKVLAPIEEVPEQKADDTLGAVDVEDIPPSPAQIVHTAGSVEEKPGRVAGREEVASSQQQAIAV